MISIHDHIYKVIKDLLFYCSDKSEEMNMLFLLWNFKMLLIMVSAGPILNIDYITRRVSFDRNDVAIIYDGSRRNDDSLSQLH